MKKRDDNLNYIIIGIIILFSFLIFINAKSAEAQSQCVPNIVNSSWSDWEDISECDNNQLNQRREFVQYDANDCGVFEDNIIEQQRIARCEYVETGLIEELENNLLLFIILIFFVLVLIVVLITIFIIIFKSNKKNKNNITKIKVQEKVREEKVTFTQVPKESFFSRIIKNWRSYSAKRRILKEQERIRKQVELERERRSELQRKEREKSRGLELIREKRRLELEKARIRKGPGIFSSFGKMINNYFEKRRKLKEERRKRKLMEIDFRKRREEEEKKEIERKKISEVRRRESEIFNLMQERKERERAIELELMREKRRKEQENIKLEFEKAKTRKERARKFRGIFSGFSQSINNYFEKRRRMKEEKRKLKAEREARRLREIELKKRREEEERKRRQQELGRERRAELQRKEREEAMELDLIRERRRLELEKSRIREQKVKRFKGVFSGFVQSINNYFTERRKIREERRKIEEQEIIRRQHELELRERKEEEEARRNEQLRKEEEKRREQQERILREEEIKREEQERKLMQEKEKEMKSMSFEEKYYPPERRALLKKAGEEQEPLPEQKIDVKNKDELLSDEFHPSRSITRKISDIQRERKNYLLERKIKEQQNKVIKEIIETKKKEIGNKKKEKTPYNFKKNIIKPRVITEVYTPTASKPKNEVKKKENEEINLIKPELKDKKIYEDIKPNLDINLGMNRMINKPDNIKNEFYNNINNLLSNGENFVLDNNLEEAREIYEKIKRIYRSEYDPDKSLHRRIISFYYNILNLMNKNK